MGSLSKETDDYMFNRSYSDSARLHLQHWLWLHRLRYILHPAIPATSQDQPLRIADVGTGNAVWIFELLPHVPPSTLIDGFDNSQDHFPASDWLPPNVSLGLFDAFGEIPSELVGKYDVVHIRTFAVIVRGNDPTTLLRNLVKMLKPGGWLQWDEMDLTTFWPGKVKDDVEIEASLEFMTKWKMECRKAGIIYDWIPTLPELFKTAAGLANVENDTFAPVNEQRKAFTDNALMGLEDACNVFSKRDREGEIGSKTTWRELFSRAVKESLNGMSITADLLVIVGQKAKQ